MSASKTERIRAGFAAHNRGDLDALVELYDPEVVPRFQGSGAACYGATQRPSPLVAKRSTRVSFAKTA